MGFVAREGRDTEGWALASVNAVGREVEKFMAEIHG
jgi:hypothetical protein